MQVLASPYSCCCYGGNGAFDYRVELLADKERGGGASVTDDPGRL